MNLIELKIEKSIFGGLGLSHYEGMAGYLFGGGQGGYVRTGDT